MSHFKAPLSCKVIAGQLIIRIGVETLAFSAAHHPDFFDPEKPTENAHIVVTDQRQFAKDVKAELEKEDEIGNSPLTQLLDAAMRNAVEAGSAAIDEKKTQYQDRWKGSRHE